MNEARAATLQTALTAHLLVARTARQAALQAWLDLQLSMGQLKSLLAIANREAVSVSGLARITGSSRPMASLLVEQLVRRELVNRVDDPADRRRCVVCLTEEGRRLVERLDPGDGAAMSRWCALLGEAELRALVRGLRALVTAGTGPPS